jgi:hypothetical protein
MKRQSSLALLASITLVACLDRPVENTSPVTSSTVAVKLQQEAVDKVDILFDIDNSASMGDKQAYLAQAIPDLITRLVTPNCVDANGGVVGQSDTQGHCSKGQVEFPPVHDMHIGIVSSSLGPRLGDTMGDPSTHMCEPSVTVTANGAMINAHNDDRGELLNRSASPTNLANFAEGTVSDTGDAHFLSWFPSVSANAHAQPSAGAPAVTQPLQLENDFQQLVTGVHEFGCGIESQLESWYRFLVQPDPYDSLGLDANGHAQWVGVDATILKQRHDFLRPDSLVAVIVLSDENDSEIDVRSFQGTGYHFMSAAWQPPRGTQACASNPEDPSCTSCNLAPNAASDPSCQQGPYSQMTDWGFNPNLRHVHMKQKYGVVPQYPIQRYVLGLSSPTVPDRAGEYPQGAGSYQGLTNRDCVNPLFAASLPDGTDTSADTLCHLKPGAQRASDVVFYAHIGGVPHQLLQVDPSKPDSPQKDALSDGDWQKILGRDPLHEDTTGIDPHMIESYQPRPGVPPPSSPDGTDPISGREWITDQGPHTPLYVDREYACTFPLAQPRDCTITDPAVQYSCDCAATGLTHEQTPAVCDPTTPQKQTYAKAYPTIRELLLAKLLGNQGIVSSLCPIHPVDQMNGHDPLYGYRPAIKAIVDRLGNALDTACLPEPLHVDAAGAVQCRVVMTLPNGGGDATVPQLLGSQLVGGSCAQSTEQGWCYVTGAAAGRCAQKIVFSPGTLPSGATVELDCLEATSSLL